MAVVLQMGVESVSYQASLVESRSDYPESPVNVLLGASIPLHLDRVFTLDVGAQVLDDAVRPRLKNPYVTVPANFQRLFNDVEAATGRETNAPPEADRIIQSARALLLRMKGDFEAFETSRNALIKA